MTKEQFIIEIAKYVQKYAPKYNICVCSPIIAQAILESAGGTSELAINANNFFGLKYKPGRCPTACGIYHKIGSEQNPDGTYTSSAMQWQKFDCMEDGVIGYFDFINISRYASLKGVTNPRDYLEKIKAAGYATSLNYVDNVYKVIQRYNLTRFDNLEKEDDNMTNRPIIALSAGHGLYTAGKRCDVTLDPNQTREWYLNDRIADIVENKLKCYNCVVVRVNDTTGKVNTPLKTRSTMSNNVNADIYIAIHHNAGAKRGTAGGTVVFYYPTANCKTIATNLYNHIISQTGLTGNRRTPIANGISLHEVRVPKANAFLIENGFMDSKIDVPIILTQTHAEKTAAGIVNFLVEHFKLTKNGNIVEKENIVQTKPSTTANDTTYTVQKGDSSLSAIGKKLGIPWKQIAALNNMKSPYIIRVGQVLKIRTEAAVTKPAATPVYGDYSLVFEPTYYANKYSDLRKAYGTNATKLLEHFKTYGMKEGRQAISTFDVKAYKEKNIDLQRAFVNDGYERYFQHYIEFGHKENRKFV